MITDYHAKYFAYELTREGGQGIDRLSRSLFDATVDLNPHQIEASLFALRNPLSKGVILADEVGLGKTIEAGLVLCQLWAERKRKLLVVCPASLRKQWAIELEEKFNVPSKIIDSKLYNVIKNEGFINPFDNNAVIICSMHFISRNASEVRAVNWDLVVIDEAHKLRNSYRESNRMGQKIKWALHEKNKILLTATPLQNSLIELYGLSSLIDDRIFADLPSFRTQYVNSGGDLENLRTRLSCFCKRTLREQVSQYIPFTERRLITRPFEPTEQEQKLYNAVSGFLQKKDSYSMPYKQKHLTALIVRKLLASSPLALAGTLESMLKRLLLIKDKNPLKDDFLKEIIELEELEDELVDEVIDDPENQIEFEGIGNDPDEEKIDLVKLNAEINDIDNFIKWANAIGVDTKAKSLLKALEIGFQEMNKTGAAKKAVIFTESRRTQEYVRSFLENNGYLNKIVIFNGTNSSPESKKIYEEWLINNKNTGMITGSKDVDIRTALIDKFKNDYEIFIATEAGAEGVNLQFCSLVINFDLPWNPQRIEQRIGRCHRYGQKHDVVVINFLNKKNQADCRVYELLEQKFNLFEGVFGASDEILGQIESGLDFEKRVLEIYQECRSEQEITLAFDTLQKEFQEIINSRLKDAKELLLEHFDEDVHERLKLNLLNTKSSLDRFSKIFWKTSKYVLSDSAKFNDQNMNFELIKSPSQQIPEGVYHLISKENKNIDGMFLYRLSHPLGEYVIDKAKNYQTPLMSLSFDISSHPTKISMIENLKGKDGWLILEELIIDSYDKEAYLLFSGFSGSGETLSQEEMEKLFNCNASVNNSCELASNVKIKLEKESDRHTKGVIAKSLERNHIHFNEARENLEKWADDMVFASEKELKDTKELIKNLTRESRKSITLEEQETIQKKIKDLENKKRRQRQKIFDIEDEIIEKRDKLIEELEKRLAQKTTRKTLFIIHWQVV